MKPTAKTLPTFIRLVLLFMVITTLFWEVIERVLELAGFSLNLSVGPIGFDIHVLALWLRLNPGTLLGIIPGLIVFKRL